MRKLEEHLRQEIDRTNERLFYFMELADRLLEDNRALVAALLAASNLPAAAAIVRPAKDKADAPKPPVSRPIGL